MLEVNSGNPNIHEEYELPPLDEVDETVPEPEVDDTTNNESEEIEIDIKPEHQNTNNRPAPFLITTEQLSNR